MRSVEVAMAVEDKDPKTGRVKLEMGRVTVQTVHIRHKGTRADHVINDVVAGRVLVPRGHTVTVEMSKPGADDLRKRMEDGAFVLELVEANA
jgi:hypothetical protein